MNNIITYYTLDQAREIIAEENRQKAIRIAKRKARKRARKMAEIIYYIKQKLLGLSMIILSIVAPFILDGDATASVIMMPIGIVVFFTKEKLY